MKPPCGDISPKPAALILALQFVPRFGHPQDGSGHIATVISFQRWAVPPQYRLCSHFAYTWDPKPLALVRQFYFVPAFGTPTAAFWIHGVPS